MSSWIGCTSQGKRVFINLDLVQFMAIGEDGTTILHFDSDKLRVKETPEEILQHHENRRKA